MSRTRADHLLVQQGLAPSRTRAQAYIMAGVVYAGDRRIDKAGTTLKSDTRLRLKGRDHPWVSRAGCKLQKAIDYFNVPVKDKIALDIGASTGGFTEVLLHFGAKYVYAVDVGYGQIAWSLRNDERVNVIEKCNARYLTPHTIPTPPQIIVCDASFISLRTLLPASLKLASDKAWAVALIKPQFEASKAYIESGGIVRNSEIQSDICTTIKNWWNSLPHWQVIGITPSPITGAKGNKEFLIAARHDIDN